MSRLSQAISEGDGISVIACVTDADSARAAQEQGAEAVAVARDVPGIRAATSLPVFWLGGQRVVDTDACLLVAEDEEDDLEARFAELTAGGHECVVDVRDEEELEDALERVDPNVFLLSPRGAENGMEPLERVLELLPDVPAGKLAIADIRAANRETVAALERAGFDAVLVAGPAVAGLIGS